ncbi:flavin reductase family protein [Planctomicrobium piriforme]|nr:flavin reductase family protein [Planctomicrobium piriforme]
MVQHGLRKDPTTMYDAFGPVLGRIPSGLFILSARGPGGEETAMLASWVQQASFAPPAVTVAVNAKRYLREWLVPGATAALSLIGETQKSVLGHFGKGFDPGEPAFEGIAIDRSPAGQAVLQDALGWIEGEVTAAIDAGDHHVILLKLTAAAEGPRLAAERPWVHVRKNGLHY